MKIFLLFTLISFAYSQFISQNLNSSGQSLNTAQHIAKDASSGIVGINSKVYYLKETETSCCLKYAYVIGVDQNGAVLFTKNINNNWDHLRKIVMTEDSCLLILGTASQACDVGGLKDFIAKVDTNGNLIFKNFFQPSWVQLYPYEIQDIATSHDTTIYLLSSDFLYSYDSNGNFFYMHSPGLSDMRAHIVLPNGNLLIHGKLNGILTNAEYDPITESIISQQSTTHSITKFERVSNGDYVALTSLGEIIKYNVGLNLIASASALSGLSVIAKDFTTKNDSVFVAGTNTSFQAFYGVLDANLNIVHSSQPTYKKVLPTGIALTSRNRINIITTCASASSPIGYTSLYQMQMNDGYSSSRDIGVKSITDVNSTVKKVGNYYVAIPEVKAEIKNYGTDTVKSFYLNGYFSGYCFTLFHKFCQVTIAPGATVAIQTGEINTNNPLMIPPGSLLTSSPKMNLCLFTTIPDFSTDIDVDNDSKCDSVLLLLPTGIQENSLAESIKIYPNPFDQGFEVKSDVLIQNIEILNSIGMVVRTKAINDKESLIGNSDLSSGIYFIRIKTEKGLVTKKLIKN